MQISVFEISAVGRQFQFLRGELADFDDLLKLGLQSRRRFRVGHQVGDRLLMGQDFVFDRRRPAGKS